MSFSVAVAGASGYAGGEALRLLLGHPEARIGTLTAHANAGSALGEHHPHLRALADRVLQPTSAETLAGHDVVVLGLPHGASGEIAAQLDPGTIVLDLGADHRLTDAGAWAQFYGGDHAGSWPYGLPELLHAGETTATAQRAALVGATRIAVPGCNVTAVTLGLQPGIAAGVIEPGDLVAVLANGYSGAGKTLKPHLLASEALGSAQPYAVGGTHRHIPEIEQNLQVAGAGAVTISFTPTLVPMARGILATATARLVPGTSAAAVRAAWEAAYADEPFVHLLPVLPGGALQWPTTAATLGSNTALVQVVVDERAGRVVTVTAIDNLVKGTAGGALQSLNLALGLPETLGLTMNGVSP
ncbi:N-acetyl-gamma-glutamyl-phosphate reductase [Pengzhenrongella frigida]|uniref:N-acetyl-gamma-glutamyl-phosphate reductase n=1 Tax=Pengzhenrongella frigida TaxID=1259133 RepID=A0A4Q5MV45_9MICO|nr:N-acetyl-gamma-glutamyl-phosphate reductase [Cellulomonas sp. HLT2-17]RYV49452.1 N-acetyl-gamma-glutamyl-phosphate reductase [Cellulomonas sp. HLT2-17]